MECSRNYPIEEYAKEMDASSWQQLAGFQEKN
jgi:hypothetical protein